MKLSFQKILCDQNTFTIYISYIYSLYTPQKIINFITNPSKQMLTKRLPFKAPASTADSHSKQLDNSLSTEQSPREHLTSTHNKQKSQLCKRFMESGFCSYNRRCKFAHGLGELKKNDHANARYKTRPCGCYLQEGFCPFGDRCNFIHPHQPAQQTPIRNMNIDFAVIKTGSINKSRLLELLGKKEI